MLDSTAGPATEDPPRLVRAALATTLATAWTVTGDARYRELRQSLVHDLTDTTDLVFADQEAYVLEHGLRAARMLGDSTAVRTAIRELETLLRRTYARGWGVRHAIARGQGSGSRSGSPNPPGLLQDQVQVAAACLSAHQVTGDPGYLDIALDLATVIDRAYADSLGGYYDVTDGPPNSFPAPGERTKHVFDDVLPGPNAQAALVLSQLATVTRDPSISAFYRRRARKTLEAFAGAMHDAGIRSTTFLAAARETLEIR
jgi:uncharacterized protein YyaL (SSP411 family)